MSLEEFNNLDVHDADVEELQFSFSAKSIKLILSMYDGAVAKYNYLEIIFLNADSITFGRFQIDEASSMELVSRDIHKNSNDTFRAKLVFLLGFGKPVLN